MSLQKKVFLTKYLVLIAIPFLINPCFSQVKKEEILLFAGHIKHIAKDYKWITVNETKVMISLDTKISDEKGNVLTIKDLKFDLYVGIEAIKNPSGILARKIIIMEPKGV